MINDDNEVNYYDRLKAIHAKTHFIRPEESIELNIQEGDKGWIIGEGKYYGKDAKLIKFDGVEPFYVYPEAFYELFEEVKGYCSDCYIFVNCPWFCNRFDPDTEEPIGACWSKERIN